MNEAGKQTYLLELTPPKIVHVKRDDVKPGQLRPVSSPQQRGQVLYDSETRSIYRKATYRVLFGRPLIEDNVENSMLRNDLPAGSVLTSRKRYFDEMNPSTNDKNQNRSIRNETIREEPDTFLDATQLSLQKGDDMLDDLFTEHPLHQYVRENQNHDILDLPSNIALQMISGMELDEYALPESETAALEPFRDTDLIGSYQLAEWDKSACSASRKLILDA